MGVARLSIGFTLYRIHVVLTWGNHPSPCLDHPYGVQCYLCQPVFSLGGLGGCNPPPPLIVHLECLCTIHGHCQEGREVPSWIQISRPADARVITREAAVNAPQYMYSQTSFIRLLTDQSNVFGL